MIKIKRYLHYNRWHHLRTNNLLWLLLSLLGILIFPAFAILLGIYAKIIFNLCYTMVVVTGIYIVTDSKLNLQIGSVLGLLSLLFLWGRDISQSFPILQLSISLVFFGFVSYQIVHVLMGSKVVTLNLIYGAIVGYMLIGIIGGQFCLLLDIIIPGSFLGEAPLTRYSYLYFSFVSLTTLGLGDIIPQNEAARAFAILISFSGQIYLTTIIAILIGKYLSQHKP